MKPKQALRLIILGSSGRMGRRVCDLADQDSRFEIRARLDREHCDFKMISAADVLIDFSTPKASIFALKWAARKKIPAVIGVTGFNSAQMTQIRALSKKTPVFWAPNFSPGVFLMKRLSREIAQVLPSYDISILETHHKMKKDAPSGTAKELAVALGSKVEIVSQRLGDVVGEHTLTFAGPFERIELTHRAHSRDLFARGTLEAASWIVRRKPGLYGMEDLLGKGHD